MSTCEEVGEEKGKGSTYNQKSRICFASDTSLRVYIGQYTGYHSYWCTGKNATA
jgi:hypothetical protein